MANYPYQESYKAEITDNVLRPLRTQQSVPMPIRYVTGETENLPKTIKEAAVLNRVVVASIAGDINTLPRDVAINIMEQWASTGDQLPPTYDVVGGDGPATALHRLEQYQQQLANAVNPKRPLLLIEGYDQLSVPLASFLIPVVLAIATHSSHNQLPGAVIMSGQTRYDQLNTHLKPINLNPYVTEDSVT